MTKRERILTTRFYTPLYGNGIKKQNSPLETTAQATTVSDGEPTIYFSGQTLTKQKLVQISCETQLTQNSFFAKKRQGMPKMENENYSKCQVCNGLYIFTVLMKLAKPGNT